MYFQSLPKTISASVPTASELSDLTSVKQNYDDLILGSSPGASNVTNAINAYNNQNINYSGGLISGKPLYGLDYGNAQNIDVVDEFIHVFARDYKHNGVSSSLSYFLNTIRYVLDQGYADGSAMETIHHIGYRFRELAKAIHLMKDELMTAGLWIQAQKMVEWYTAVDIIWHPTAYDSNMDDGLTRAISILGACLYKSTDIERVQYLKGYTGYLQNWLNTYAKEGNGLKVDYTGFHHNTYYPGYAFGTYNSLAQAVNLISSGSFRLSTPKRELLKNTLLMSRVLMSGNNIPNSLSGRTPLNSISISKGLKQLGLATPEDTQLLKAYNYISGGDADTNAFGVETPPMGFWQINFANMGAYRQGTWVADVKGFSKYFWGSEIYSSDNRYGRYQSYGALEIMYAGGHINSGFNSNGWNWNMPPGTTTIHLDWNDLKAQNSRQDETTDSNFAASLRFGAKASNYIDGRLEGKHGVFGMDFNQKGISGSHNTTFAFKKSVFFFDGKMICLGSNINNNDASNSTATNVFQNALSSSGTPINIDNTATSSFPFNNALSTTTNHWVIDAVNTGYYIKSGQNIIIDRKNQSSPHENGSTAFTSGNFASAYIDHGTAPANGSYEYVVIPDTNAGEMSSLSATMASPGTAFYEVIQQDQTAHIVKYNELYGYVFFQGGNYTGSGPIKSNDKPCLVMTENINGDLHLSLVNPDLNFAANNGPSQMGIISLVLDGDWNMSDSNGGLITVTPGVGETILEIEAKDGLAVDMVLQSGAYNPFYPIFYYEDFGADTNRGFSVQIVSNPNTQDPTLLGRRVGDIPDTADSNGVFTETRPSNRIPMNSGRDQKAISIKGTSSSTNFQLETWVVMETLDVSTANPYISQDDLYKHVSFWTEQRYANGGISGLQVMVSTNYLNDVTTASWTDVTSSLVGQIATSNQNGQTYMKSVLDISSYTSTTFTLAFKYTSAASAYSSTNRNGTFYVSDVKFYVSNESLSVSEGIFEQSIKVYPNPTSGKIDLLSTDPNVNIESISLFDIMGKMVMQSKSVKTIDVSHLAKGMYLLKIKEASSNSILVKKLLIH